MAEYNEGNNTSGTLNGLFKEVYAEKLKNLVPDGVKFYNMVQFIAEDKKNGSEYHQPVSLSNEHGITYGGYTATAFALNDAIAGSMADAKVQGYEMVLKSALSVGAVSRSQNKNAFEKATKYVVANMVRSMAKRIEISMFYGQSGIGVVESVSTDTVTISDDSWASGIWSGGEGMAIDVYDAAMTTLQKATKVVSIDFDNKTCTVTAGDGASIAATDVIFFKGANSSGTFYEMPGLYKIATNTGTLFNISAATYNLWKGNNVTTAQDISFGAIESAIGKAVAKGLDEDVICFVNVDHWNVLLDDIVAKRSFDQSYSNSKATDGSREIEFYGQNGMIKIVPSIYVKGSHAFILPLSAFSRVGSSDITFDQPGLEGKFINHSDAVNGYILKAYSDQALFCSCPGKIVVLSSLNIA